VLHIPLAELRGDAAPAHPGEQRPSERSERPLRILVIDDNVDAAELLAESLRLLGYETRIAFDGPRGLEVAAHFRPDVALVDLGLPVMDGFEVARALRASPETADIALAAITGYGQETDRQLTREVGFQQHLVKPIELDELAAWLARQPGRPRSPQSPPPADV